MRMIKTFVAAVAWWNVIASEPLGEGAVMMMIGMFDNFGATLALGMTF